MVSLPTTPPPGDEDKYTRIDRKGFRSICASQEDRRHASHEPPPASLLVVLTAILMLVASYAMSARDPIIEVVDHRSNNKTIDASQHTTALPAPSPKTEQPQPVAHEDIVNDKPIASVKPLEPPIKSILAHPEVGLEPDLTLHESDAAEIVINDALAANFLGDDGQIKPDSVSRKEYYAWLARSFSKSPQMRDCVRYEHRSMGRLLADAVRYCEDDIRPQITDEDVVARVDIDN